MSNQTRTGEVGGAKWTPEPWIAEANASYWEIRSSDWEFGGIGDTCASSASEPEYGRSMALGESNAERIVSCVNAMQGIDDPAAFVKAAKAAHEHIMELREAWQRGCISEHDGLGGTRSNRNVEVDVALRAALQSAKSLTKRGA